MASNNSQKCWVIRRSSIHSRGVFALCDIPKETRIMEYVGEKITKAESDRRGTALMEKSKKTGGAAVYIFTLNKKFDLDGAKFANPARLINHSCDPNCEAIVSRGRVWIYALRDIKAGEELSYNYGFDIDTWEDHPCRCGAKNCVGYILDKDLWPKLRIILREREARRKKIRELEARARELRRQLRELSDNPASTVQANGRAAKAKKPRKARRATGK